METPQEPEMVLGGHRVVNFCTNNYLGLAGDPRLIEAGAKAMRQYGAGGCASRIISANLPVYEQLEDAVAEWKGAESALLFNSGYQANLGVIPVLASSSDIIFIDEGCHPSSLDGVRLSRANIQPFRHNHMNQLEDLLDRFRSEPGRRLIVTEAVFNTGGDLCPMKDIFTLAVRYGATVYVDECHAVGVFGDEGEGLVPRPLPSFVVTMGTFGKALGSYGAFVCGSSLLKDYLINYARTFLFSTSLPPASAAAALEGIKIVRGEPERRRSLWNNIDYLQKRLMVIREPSPIFTMMTGSSEEILRQWTYLIDSNLYVQEIRPPIVPEGQCRLRVSLTSRHTESHLNRLLDCLSNSVNL